MRRFIFLCQGTYHLLVSSSFSRQIQDSSAEKILIYDESTEYKINPEKICPYFDQYIRIPGKAREGGRLGRQWFKLAYEGYFFPLTVASQLKGKPEDEYIFICFNDKNRIFDRIAGWLAGKKHLTVMVEEGVGNYFLSSASPGKECLGSKIWNRFFLGARPYPSRMFGNDSRIDLFVMKDPDKFPVEKLRNRRLIPYPKIDYAMFDHLVDKILDEFFRGVDLQRKWVLYLGDIFDGEEHVPWDVEQECLKELFRCLAEQEFFVIIKPHPRDPRGKYRSLRSEIVLDFEDTELAWIPVECLAGKLHPPVVMTPCSSGAEFFLTEEYCKEILYLYTLFPEALKHDSEYFLRLEETYSKVSVIKNYAELEEKLAICCKW